MLTDSITYEEFTSYSPHSTIGPYRSADFLQLPEGEPVELLRGRFVVSPCPTPRHQMIVLQLALHLERICQQTGDLVFPAPMDVVLSDDTILQPDIALIRASNRGRVQDRIQGPADLVIEVLSPSTSRRDRLEKLDLYAKYGIAEYWIVDPESRVFDFYTNHNGTFTVTMSAKVYQSPQFVEVQIDLDEFWKVIDRRLPN